jgi:hypothetical protein
MFVRITTNMITFFPAARINGRVRHVMYMYTIPFLFYVYPFALQQ